MKKKHVAIGDKEFRKNIAEKLGLSYLTENQQNKLIFMFMDIVASKINVAIWDRLSKDNKNQLKKMSSKKALNLVHSQIKDLPQLVEAITRQVANEFRAT